MKRAAWKAIVVGNLVDVACTLVITVALVMQAHTAVRHPGMSNSEIRVAAMAYERLLPHRILGFVGGCLSSIAAGYIAARIAGRNQIFTATMSSIFCVSMSLFGYIFLKMGDPLWLAVILTACGPLCAAFGGVLARSKSPA